MHIPRKVICNHGMPKTYYKCKENKIVSNGIMNVVCKISGNTTIIQNSASNFFEYEQTMLVLR